MNKFPIKSKTELLTGLLLLLLALLASVVAHNYPLALVFLITGLIFTAGGMSTTKKK